MRRDTVTRFSLLAGGMLAVILSSHTAFGQRDAAALYARNCASCHDSGSPDIRAPGRDVMKGMSAEAIVRALDSGAMAQFAQNLSPPERQAIAEYLAGSPIARTTAAGASPQAGACTGAPTAFSRPFDVPGWNGWGAGVSNKRFQPAEAAGITPQNVGRLELKWAFGFAGAVSAAAAQPTVVGGRIFIGGGDRKVHALDAKTGCLIWEFAPDAPVRTAVMIAPEDGSGRYAAFFGDGRANAYALDAETGALLWKQKLDEHPAARITGAPTAHAGVVYVPVASFEEATGTRNDDQCCTFRGSVVALNARTGAHLWRAFTIPDEPKPTKKNAIGTQLYGPSGAAVWSSPTIDEERQALYVATGNSYSNPPAATSDAVVALNLKTGDILWHQQFTPNDAYIVGCASGTVMNCPDNPGPDYDFGQSPILTHLPDGRRVLVIAQKSGVAHALDPDHQGKILWQTRLGKGGALGGSQWGSAVDQDRIYVAISDIRFLSARPFRADPTAGGGLFGLDLASGKVTLTMPPVPCGERNQCSPALSAAVTAIPGVVFSGGVSGILRAYATTDGHLLWEFDTERDFTTVNGVPGHGGAMNGSGPTIVDGVLYVTSGYALWGGRPGNVLLAFSVKDH
ncbi:MAG TPA: PQQ-binding-like beta-propeller repeat protein [Acetobacteraceae bacterium]|nr:PQQ-binding-like beta-propeller repeat protein [Acetobacteraceae bacterium]